MKKMRNTAVLNEKEENRSIIRKPLKKTVLLNKKKNDEDRFIKWNNEENRCITIRKPLRKTDYKKTVEENSCIKKRKTAALALKVVSCPWIKQRVKDVEA